MTPRLPPRCALVPVGAPGSGKSTLLEALAAAHDDPGLRFGADDVRSLAFGTRAYLGAGHLVHASARAFFAARLAADRSAAYDATNTVASERRLLLEIARRHHAFPVAILFKAETADVLRRNLERSPDVVVPDDVVERFHRRVAALSATSLLHEGFRLVQEVAIRDDDFSLGPAAGEHDVSEGRAVIAALAEAVAHTRSARPAAPAEGGHESVTPSASRP